MSYRKIGREAVFEGLTRRLVHHGHRLRRRDFRGRGRRHGLWPCLESLEQRTLLTTGVLILPNTPSPPTFTATIPVNEAGIIVEADEDVSGGNFLGTLNGTTLTASYCVSIDLTISPLSTYNNATVTSYGTIYGAAVPNAGAISWLLKNIGPTAITAAQQDALQAAIWRTEYGDNFQLDGVDNDNGAPAENSTIAPIYQADLAALGNNTAPVSSVDWISPDEEGMNQGLVALPTITSPPQIIQVDNWAGYVAQINIAKPASGAVTKVSGSWRVPTVNESSKSGVLVSVWVGMDGWNDTVEPNKTVEQIGTAGYLQPNGTVFYQAWYQMVPGPFILIPTTRKGKIPSFMQTTRYRPPLRTIPGPTNSPWRSRWRTNTRRVPRREKPGPPRGPYQLP